MIYVFDGGQEVELLISEVCQLPNLDKLDYDIIIEKIIDLIYRGTVKDIHHIGLFIERNAEGVTDDAIKRIIMLAINLFIKLGIEISNQHIDKSSVSFSYLGLTLDNGIKVSCQPLRVTNDIKQLSDPNESTNHKDRGP